MVVYMAANSTNGPNTVSIDFREVSPMAATQSMFPTADDAKKDNPDDKEKGTAINTGPLYIAVPGELRGLELAHRYTIYTSSNILTMFQ